MRTLHASAPLGEDMPLNIDVQQILLHMFNLVILTGGLYLLLYKPVADFMQKREDHFANLEKQAQEKNAQADEVLAAYNAKLSSVDEEIRRKNDAAAQEADRQRQERLQRTQAEADKILSDARKTAAAERDAMLQNAQKDIAQLVVSATGRLMEKENDAEANKALYDSFLKAAQEEKKHG